MGGSFPTPPGASATPDAKIETERLVALTTALDSAREWLRPVDPDVRATVPPRVPTISLPDALLGPNDPVDVAPLREDAKDDAWYAALDRAMHRITPSHLTDDATPNDLLSYLPILVEGAGRGHDSVAYVLGDLLMGGGDAFPHPCPPDPLVVAMRNMTDEAERHEASRWLLRRLRETDPNYLDTRREGGIVLAARWWIPGD